MLPSVICSVNSTLHGLRILNPSGWSFLPSNAVALSPVISIATGDPPIDIEPLVWRLSRPAHAPSHAAWVPAGTHAITAAGSAPSTAFALPPPSVGVGLAPLPSPPASFLPQPATSVADINV